MDGRFAALEDMMKKMLEDKQKPATSESKETTGGHKRGGIPNPFRGRSMTAGLNPNPNSLYLNIIWIIHTGTDVRGISGSFLRLVGANS
ncbi:hypothetical protein M5K25_010201 [Dendrobium thyrsiflorum]|uniref:Uncharacterized protein n=1 Tax=Dendrobium thyrsiflorum TaxID=117978 RepID=A0ABD0V644_DENTH